MANDLATAMVQHERAMEGHIGPSMTAMQSVRLRPARRIELVAHLSGAFDLAEGQPVGHAARVAHVALAVASRLGFDSKTRQQVAYTALLHDAGVAVRLLPEDVEDTGGHAAAGAWAAELLELDEGVQNAIRATHERWDGTGRPQGRAMMEIPVEALIVSAAHWVNDQVGEGDHPLRVRAKLQGAAAAQLHDLVGPQVAAALTVELRSDDLWMSFWSERLPGIVAEQAAGSERSTVKTVERVAEAIGELVDSAQHEPQRSARVALLASELGTIAGLKPAHRKALAVAAHLMDVGELGVPRHIIEKPDILTLGEMETMRRHPGWGARLLESLPGFEAIAAWVEFHHERPDGRGYPEMLESSAIPLPSRILGVADAYWALRAERPYRAAMESDDALEVIQQAAGEQFDETVVSWLPRALEALPPGVREAPPAELLEQTMLVRTAVG